MSVYLGNVKDPAVKKVLKLLPLQVCHCFDRESVSAGHDVNPPCAAISLARRIVSALEEGQDVA